MVSVYDNLGGGRTYLSDVFALMKGSMLVVPALQEHVGIIDQISSFIEENHAYKLQQRKEQHMQPSFGGYSQDLMSYWGYKFETISLLPDQWDATPREFIENREKFVVNNYAQYCSVAKTAIGKAKLIIGGEVDAVWDCKPENKHDQINWVELKTSAEIYTDKDRIKYERKLLKMWIQSFLLGVPKIIVGFRSKDGILKRLEEVQTEKIPGLVKRNSGIWDGNICINFTAAFLDWLKEVITGDGVWRIRRREKSPIIEAFVQEVTGHGDILSPEFLAWRTRGSNRDPNVAKFSTETDLEELKATV
ncbi:MAG: decapping endonuclease targeting mRNA [Icmadophila ericetorum]|nr:decapping endonuclease targeting mRNA [Icmadophila ericetorum]